MLESLKHEDLQFQELTPEEKQTRGILARLTGPIASFTKGTRNGRKYSDKLWEKAFEAPLVKEMFKNGGLPGELQHPADRSETDPTKIAIMMPEPPKKDSNGHLVASVDILDTPCGQIAYQLGKYGFKFGISSRGEGDLVTDYNGEESVDPDTYTLNGFDLVLIPACEDARLQFNESLDTKKNNKLRTILGEALNNASASDRKIMEEVIDELNIDDNWRYVENYKGEDIFYDPESDKYIVGTIANQTILNSLENAKQYVDRFAPLDEEVLTEEQIGREETKDAKNPTDLLQNKPENEKEEPQPQEEKDVVVNVTNETQPQETTTVEEEEEKEDLKESIYRGFEIRENDNDLYSIYDADGIEYTDNLKDVKSAKAFIDTEVDEWGEDAFGGATPFKDDINEEIYDGYNSDRQPWDTDFHRLDVAYDHNFKQFDDMEADSGRIRDFTDDLDANGKQYDIYKHKSDPGCTVFFQESLSLNEGKEYTLTFHDGPTGNLRKTLDVYAENSDEALSKGYEYARNNDLTSQGYTDITCQEKSPDDKLSCYGAEVSGTDGWGDRRTDYMFFLAKNKNDVKDFIHNNILSKVSLDPNGKIINGDNNWGKNVTQVDKINDIYEATCNGRGINVYSDSLEYTNLDEDINDNEELDDNMAADDDGAIVEQLQNILKQNKKLEEKIKSLQEKISVGYAKELELTEEIDNYKEKVSKLSSKSKEVKVLTEKLSKANEMLEKARQEAKGDVEKLNESISSKDYVNNKLQNDNNRLQESIEKKNGKIKSLSEQLHKYKGLVESKDKDLKDLEGKYADGQKDLEQLKNQYSKKVEQQNRIIEKYQRVAKNSVKRYIESQAVRLGVKSDEIVNRLPKNYSFNDIDTICEDLQEYKFNMSNLPFSQQGLNENLTVTAKNVQKGPVEKMNPEDEITDYDLRIAEAFL